MARTRIVLIYWLPVIVWMSVIFTASSDAASYQHSSRIVGPLLHWLFPHLSEAATDTAVLVARKCAHLTEYAGLAFLLWRAFRRPALHDPRPWHWREARLAVLIVALYAATDEFHQVFVPTREPALHDVALDTFGGLVGVSVIWLFHRWRTRRRYSSLPD